MGCPPACPRAPRGRGFFSAKLTSDRLTRKVALHTYGLVFGHVTGFAFSHAFCDAVEHAHHHGYSFGPLWASVPLALAVLLLLGTAAGWARIACGMKGPPANGKEHAEDGQS